MKKIFMFCLMLISAKTFSQEINKSITPLNSPGNGGLDVKKVTFVERLALKNPKLGEVVYDVSVGAYYVYSGSNWVLSKTLSPASNLPIMNAGTAANAVSYTVPANSFLLVNGAATSSVSDGGTVALTFHATNKVPSSNIPLATTSSTGGVRNGTVITTSGGALAIVANSISTSHLANNAVSSDKIQALSIFEAKIAASAITNSKIADDAVTTDKIENNAVTPTKIAPGNTANQVLTTIATANGDGTTTYSTEWANAAAGGGGSGFLGTYTAVNRATSDAVKDSLNLNNGTPADVNITGLFGQAIAATDQLSSVGLSFANNTYTNNSGATVYVRVSTNITFRRNYIDNAERLVWLEYLPNGGSGVTVARANSKGVVLANQTLSLSGVTLKLANGDGFAIKARSAGGDATNPVFVGGLSAVDNLTIDRVK